MKQTEEETTHILPNDSTSNKFVLTVREKILMPEKFRTALEPLIMGQKGRSQGGSQIISRIHYASFVALLLGSGPRMPEHFCKTVIISMISTQSCFVHGQQATCLGVRLMKPSFLTAIENLEVYSIVGNIRSH